MASRIKEFIDQQFEEFMRHPVRKAGELALVGYGLWMAECYLDKHGRMRNAARQLMHQQNEITEQEEQHHVQE